jgi:hypothetical protein
MGSPGPVGPPPPQPNAQQPNTEQLRPPPVTATPPLASQSGVNGPPPLTNASQPTGPPAANATPPPANAAGLSPLPGATQQATAPAGTPTQASAGAPGEKVRAHAPHAQDKDVHSGHASTPSDASTTGAREAGKQPNAQQSVTTVHTQAQGGPPDSAKNPDHSLTGKVASNPATTNSANQPEFPGLGAQKGDSFFPPTNLTFDHIQNPAARASAFENQRNLAESERTFGPEYKEIVHRTERASLQRNESGKLSIDLDGPSTVECLKDIAQDKATDKGVEKAFETLVHGVAGDAAEKLAPAIGTILDGLRNLQNFNDDNKYLGRITPEAKEWQEKKIVGLVCDKMASAAVERAKAEHQPVLVEYRERERLMDNYYKMKELIETQAKNMPRPTHRSIDSISAPR